MREYKQSAVNPVVRILKQFVVQPLYVLAGIGARLHWPFLTAATWYLLTVRTRRYGTSKNRKRLLALTRLGGTEDLYASLSALGECDIEVWTMARRYVTVVFTAFVPKSVTDYVYVSSDPKVETAKKRYREFLKAVWRFYAKWRRISGVVGFSIFYCAERELAAACAEEGTPFLILYKEGVETVAEHKRDEHVYRFRLGSTGRAISVYNQEEKDIIVHSGFAPEDRVVVTGCPRIDPLHAARRNGNQQTEPGLVVFFSFSPTTGVGLPWVEEKWWGNVNDPPIPEGFHWEELAHASHLALVELARKRPDLLIIVKVKVGKENTDFVDSVLPSKLPRNLIVRKGGVGESLAQRASVIIGFNSTAVLSGIATGKPVVVPRFGEALRPEAQYCIFDLRNAVLWADSPKELIRIVEDATTYPQPSNIDLSPEKKRVLERYVGNPDGRAGERMGAFILRNIQP